MYQEIFATCQRRPNEQFEADMIALLEQTGFLDFHSSDDVWEGGVNRRKSWFTVKDTDYLFVVDNIISTPPWAGFRVLLYKGDKSSQLYNFLPSATYIEGDTVDITLRFINSDTLRMLHLTVVSGGTVYLARDCGVYAVFSDLQWRLVEPLDAVDYSFHKKYFTKRDTGNNLLLTPARMSNNANKLVQVYPTSCYYCNNAGLVNSTFYTFTDGSVGYYKGNIIFK